MTHTTTRWTLRQARVLVRNLALAFAASLTMTGCHHAARTDDTRDDIASTLARIERAAQAYVLPGHAVVVFDRSGVLGERYEGAADLESGRPVTAATLFPVASLTKTWSAVVVLQLVAEGRLRLDQPVFELLPTSRLPVTVQVQHLLSHTSHGTPGRAFHYDGRRYGALGRIVESVTGTPFAEVLRERIIVPLGLRDTFVLGDSAADTPRLDELALPYRDEGTRTRCDIEYGHSASAGLVTTARDVATFNRALWRGDLLAPAQRARIVMPYLQDGPTGLGSFVQRVDGRQLVWAYGQYDCYAALTLMDTTTGDGMVFLANDSTPSDSARLLYGDVRASPLALAWLGVAEDSPWQARSAILREAFFSAAHPQRLDPAIDAATRVLDRHPDQRATPDLVMVHALVALRDAAWRHQQRRVTAFDAAIEAKASAVLARDPGNVYAHYYLASLHASRGEHVAARVHYETIVVAPNMPRGWYTVEAEAALAGKAE